MFAGFNTKISFVYAFLDTMLGPVLSAPVSPSISCTSFGVPPPCDGVFKYQLISWGCVLSLPVLSWWSTEGASWRGYAATVCMRPQLLLPACQLLLYTVIFVCPCDVLCCLSCVCLAEHCTVCLVGMYSVSLSVCSLPPAHVTWQLSSYPLLHSQWRCTWTMTQS